LIEQSFDETGIREVSCFGAVPIKALREASPALRVDTDPALAIIAAA
jgi:hypothetical protein